MRCGLWNVSPAQKREGRRLLQWCTCDCGSQHWVRVDHLKNGVTHGCRKCADKRKAKRAASNTEGAIVQILRRARRGAKVRGIEYTITDEYAIDLFRKQEYRCALSGLPIVGSGRNKNRQSASIDRIDSSKGYIEENVQWVDKRVNMMKQGLSQAAFVELCRAISSHDIIFQGA